MSKAIYGAALIAGAAATFFTWGAAGAILPLIIGAMASTGISLEAAAISQALTDQRGMGITTREAAGLRQIVYGQQRIGGVTVYESTTGANGSSGNYVYNYVIVLASHILDSIVNVYLDGRKISWSQVANHQGFHSNIGCGTVSEPPATQVTIVGGVITAITASTFGSGFAEVAPQDGYRVRIYDPAGSGSGAVAWAYQVNGDAWNVTIANGGNGYSSQTIADIQGAYTFGGNGANTEQTPWTDATATISNGAVVAINSTTYWLDSFHFPSGCVPIVSIGGGGGYGATAHCVMSGVGTCTTGGTIANYVIDDGGQGYTSAPNVTVGTGNSGVRIGHCIGPGGQSYEFQDKLYCEARFGDQPIGDYMQSLTSNDSTWAQSTLGGGAVAHVKVSDIIVGKTVTAHGVITSVLVDEGGSFPSGFTPTVTFISHPQTGVKFIAQTGTGATAHAVMGTLSNGMWTVKSIVVDTGGTFYGAGTTQVAFDSVVATTPSLSGCAYIYLNLGYDTSLFPSAPEIRITVNGKPVYDPRTEQTAFSSNWALQVADVIADPVFGLGDSSINAAQLIAAANVCDEQVQTSQGLETNFAQNIHYDTSTAPGDALALMMPSAGGKLSRVGGEWYIWPAYWQGPSFTADESMLLDTAEWNPFRSKRDLYNRVNGTYVAPNSPYNVAGNLYDANGWYYGTTANLWPLAWQPTNYPQYACDDLHGYASDVFLVADGGYQLPKELSLRGVNSIVQAQRLAKIDLMRNRFQGTGAFKMSLAAWQMIPTSIMQFTWPALNMTNQYLEVDRIQMLCEPMKDENGEEGAPALSLAVSVSQTDPSCYEWEISEELTPYDVEACVGAGPTTPAPPTNIVLADSSATAVMQPDGTIMPRLLVTWTAPNDVYVTAGGSIQVQWQDASGNFNAGAWIDVGTFSGSATSCFVDGVSSVTAVDIQIRSLWANGAASPWQLASSGTTFHGKYRPMMSTTSYSSSMALATSQALATGTPQTLPGMAWTITALSPADTYNIIGTISAIFNGVSGAGAISVSVVVDGGSTSYGGGNVYALLDHSGTVTTSGAFVASISGLTAGSHTVTVVATNNSTGYFYGVSCTGSAVCQHVC